MTYPSEHSRAKAQSVFIWTVITGSQIYLVAAVLFVQFPIPRVDHSIFWILLSLTLGIPHTRLPVGGAITEMGEVVDLAALATVGPFPVIISNILSCLLTDHILRQKQPLRVIFNVSELNAAALTAYLILFSIAGGRILNFSLSSFVAVLVAYLVYSLITTGLVSTVIALGSREGMLSVWRRNHLYHSLVSTAAAPLPLIMVVLFNQYGAIPVLLVAIPVMVMTLLSQFLIDEARKQARADRDQQLTRIGKVSASVLHEISKPLSRIVMTSDFALSGEMPPEEALKQNMADAHDAHSLSERLLGAMRFEPSRTVCNATQVLNQLAEMAAQEDIPLDIVSEQDLSQFTGMWDRELVVAALQNLLRNAWESQRKSGPAPRVHASSAEAAEQDTRENRAVLRFIVSDSGHGIPPELESDLFEALFSTKETGFGIGLFLANQVALAHGGQLSARNAEQGGAEFILDLPLDQEYKLICDRCR